MADLNFKKFVLQYSRNAYVMIFFGFVEGESEVNGNIVYSCIAIVMK